MGKLYWNGMISGLGYNNSMTIWRSFSKLQVMFPRTLPMDDAWDFSEGRTSFFRKS